MIAWFRDDAPIRTKFAALGIVYTGSALIALAATGGLAAGRVSSTVAVGIVAGVDLTVVPVDAVQDATDTTTDIVDAAVPATGPSEEQQPPPA